MEAICAGDYVFEPEEYWANVSETARDFVRTCLTLDPAKRPTATEALQHRWLASETPHFVSDPDSPTGGPRDLLPTIQKGFNARKTCTYIFTFSLSSVAQRWYALGRWMLVLGRRGWPGVPCLCLPAHASSAVQNGSGLRRQCLLRRPDTPRCAAALHDVDPKLTHFCFSVLSPRNTQSGRRCSASCRCGACPRSRTATTRRSSPHARRSSRPTWTSTWRMPKRSSPIHSFLPHANPSY